MTMPRFPKNPAIAMAIALLFSAPAFAETTEETLLRRVDDLSRQLDALKAEVRELKVQNQALAAPAAAYPNPPPAAVAANAPPPADNGVVSALPSVLERASLSGYGEVNYNRYDHDASRTEATLRRAVFGIGYRFNENTRFVSEFEVENSVVSASDGGEFEVEQFYIDHRITDWASVKAGLILIPSGYLNEVHEPPRYFGVERNFVETAIIPTTEREGGVAVHGSVLDGLNYDAGLTTGFNLANWDFTSTDGQASPLGSIHQELSNARAADIAEYAALNYNGVPGFNVGASVFTGGAGQSQPNFAAAHSRFLLWEAHTRWRPGRWDLSALYAHGSLSDTAAANLANAGAITPIPEAFHGWYLQGAYRLWQHGTLALSPFVRYERYNTGDTYAAQPAGLGTPGRETETVRTYGFSFFLNPDVVFKADYQQFGLDRAANRVNLGLGLQFY